MNPLAQPNDATFRTTVFLSVELGTFSGDETYDEVDTERRLDVQTVVGMLDDRQRRVCRMLSQGLAMSAIAQQLGCSWHTVQRIVRDIRRQFEAHGFGEE